MKKQLLIIAIFILIIGTIWSQDMSGYIEAGIIPTAQYAEKIDKFVYNEYGLQYLTIAVQGDIKPFIMGGEITTYMSLTKREDRISFYPLYSSYTIFGQLYYNNIILGVEHNCSHETVGSSYIGTILNFQSAYDKIYVKIKF